MNNQQIHPISRTTVVTLRSILGTFLLSLWLMPGLTHAASVSVSGHQLLVNCSPFMVRGVNYNPVPIADNDQEWAYGYNVTLADLAQMKLMGVNTIRVYFNYAALIDTDGSVNAAMKANYDRLLAAAAADGIYVIPDFWVPYNVDYTVSANLTQIETQFAAVINLFKDLNTYPNILMWALGDENNSSTNLTPMSDTQMFQFYQNVIAYEKANADTSHPYTAVLVNNNDINNGSLTGLVSSIDLWSVNVYLAASSTWTSNIISPYSLTKPLLITEFGNDAYNNNTGTEDDADQSSFYSDVWPNAIGNNLSALNSSNKLLGGCVFEWCDEWWKCGGDSTHDSCGETLNVLPDNYANEEWFGLSTALAIGSTGPRTYRTAYNTLQSFWTNSPYNTTVPADCSLSPTPSPTFSPTPAPTYGAGCVTVVDDFNNAAGGTNTFNGTWSTSFGSGSGGALNYTSPGYSGYSMQFSWSIASGSYGECFTGLSATANPTGAGTGMVNLSNYGQVSFWVVATVPGAYWFKVASTQTYGGAGYSWWQAPFNVTSMGWTQVTLNLNSTTFSNPNGNSGTFAQNLQNATQLVFQPQTNGAAYLWIDDVDLVTNSCLTAPTATTTATSTETRTASATSTATASATSTATNSSTSTATRTSTNTATSTSTSTPANTSTSTATQTATPTMTFTAAHTNTATSTSTLTPASTYTDTSTPTIGNTQTDTSTQTLTNSPTASSTSTVTSTATSTATLANTATVTNSATNSATHTVTYTPTTTNTAPNTMTGTSTPTTTSTKTSTATNTVTQTFTITNTPLNTSTSTLSPTQSSTQTLTSTPTVTNSQTVTNTQTVTLTATNTQTYTTTATATNTVKIINTSTGTATPILTNTFSTTSTTTPTGTATAPFTATPTPLGLPAPVIYPNPCTGSTISIYPGLETPVNVKIKIYTLAFRMVYDSPSQLVMPGQSVAVRLLDRMGAQLADGLYYVSVVINGKNSISKLLILR